MEENGGCGWPGIGCLALVLAAPMLLASTAASELQPALPRFCEFATASVRRARAPATSHLTPCNSFGIPPTANESIVSACCQEILGTRSLGALRVPTSSWRPFGPLDFVLRAPQAFRPVRRACLRSGPVKIGLFFLKMGLFWQSGAFLF